MRNWSAAGIGQRRSTLSSEVRRLIVLPVVLFVHLVASVQRLPGSESAFLGIIASVQTLTNPPASKVVAVLTLAIFRRPSHLLYSTPLGHSCGLDSRTPRDLPRSRSILNERSFRRYGLVVDVASTFPDAAPPPPLPHYLLSFELRLTILYGLYNSPSSSLGTEEVSAYENVCGIEQNFCYSAAFSHGLARPARSIFGLTVLVGF